VVLFFVDSSFSAVIEAAGAELPEKLFSGLRNGKLGVIDFKFLSLEFGFDATGTLNFLNNGDLLYKTNGGIYPKINGQYLKPPQANTVHLPDFGLLAPSKAKLVATPWVLSCGLWAALQHGLFTRTITQETLGASSIIQLTTDSSFWLGAIPGLAQHPHLNLTLGITPKTKWPLVSFLPGNTLSFGALSFQVAVNLANGANVVLPNAVVLGLNLAFSLNTTLTLTSPQTLQASFVWASMVPEISVVSTQVGEVKTDSFKAIMILGTRYFVPVPINVTVYPEITIHAATLTTSPTAAVLLANITVKA